MQAEKTEILIHNLKMTCHVGVPIVERRKSQVVQIDIRCELGDPNMPKDHVSFSANYSEIIEQVHLMLESSTFVLLETLTEAVAEMCMKNSLVVRVTVRAIKPQKIPSCDAVGVERVFRRDS